MRTTKFTCPCCGYCTLDEQPPGTYDICELCFWEDDPVQFNDPDYKGGANQVSLREAQRNFSHFGTSEERFRQRVRASAATYLRDPNWHPLA